MDTMRQPEFYLTFSEEMGQGKLPERTAGFLQKYIDAFERWIARAR